MDAKAQVEGARRACLAVPRADLGTLVVTGKDRVTWLNGLLTCDIVNRGPDAAVYGLVVGRNGRVLADAAVVFDEESSRILVATPMAVLDATRAHLDRYLVMEDAEVVPGGDGYEVWALHGPQSQNALQAARSAGVMGGMVDWTGLGGALLFAPTNAARGVREILQSVAQVGTVSGWEALRLERAIPSFGVDFDDKTYPQEAALEKTAVSFQKGCYLGQEVVCMLEMRGHVKRRLVPLVLAAECEEPPAGGTIVMSEEGAPVGEVTSAAVSPTLDRVVALAMLKRALASAGKRVRILGMPAEVVERPA
jgi:folate-binding protein YgfZ